VSRRSPHRKLRIGTRGSDLALTQSGTIADQLRSIGAIVELEIIQTAGDRSSAPSFGSIGPQGVFVREIEQSLIDGVIDLAVHSFKDLPTQSPEGLIVAAVPERIDPADILLIRTESLDKASDSIIPLRPAAKIGTAAARRNAWIRHYRDDIELASLRGNVPTRIARLKQGRYDAIVLAAAGVARLRPVEGLLDSVLEGIEIERLDTASFVPAPAQGALAVQCRSDDTELTELLGQLDDPASRAAVSIERQALAQAEGGCDIAFGAHCVATDTGFTLTTMLERSGRVGAVVVTGSDVATLGATGWAALDKTFT